MLKRTERIPVLSKVETEPDLHTGSGSEQNFPAPTGSGSATLPETDLMVTTDHYLCR